ncbi:MAG: tRNA 2-thiouridine(34) synthase MnmA [Oscillospiraceae bacterium]|nr:tRNA 2-thiouridine(34) synthase MnmA [Oscillospiraceae bacterium]
MKKVLLGMSGGVDSSVSAVLLMEQGYEVIGCSLQLYDADACSIREGGCCTPKDICDAKSMCASLGIKHITLSYQDMFRKYIITPFVNSYLGGRTPNPCIECNYQMKFGVMLDTAEEMGYDYAATGHYADIRFNDATGRYELCKAKDRAKDQTYVLYRLTQHQLAHTLFPLAGYTKPEIREIAAKHDLISSKKPDSQDICFVSDGDYAGYIRRYSGNEEKGGVFADKEGNILGTHGGVSRFTVGQRKGLGIALGKPVFVVSKDAKTGVVTLGDERDLYRREIDLEDVNLVSLAADGEYRLNAKIRYSAKEQPCTALIKGDKAHIIFDDEARAPAPGQACVLYDGDAVAAGGVITADSV